MTKQPESKKDCPCTSTGCTRHGKCELCTAYHFAKGQKTSCGKQGNRDA